MSIFQHTQCVLEEKRCKLRRKPMEDIINMRKKKRENYGLNEMKNTLKDKRKEDAANGLYD